MKVSEYQAGLGRMLLRPGTEQAGIKGRKEGRFGQRRMGQEVRWPLKKVSVAGGQEPQKKITKVFDAKEGLDRKTEIQEENKKGY